MNSEIDVGLVCVGVIDRNVSMLPKAASEIARVSRERISNAAVVPVTGIKRGFAARKNCPSPRAMERSKRVEPNDACRR